jgi:hypothetical protein
MFKKSPQKGGGRGGGTGVATIPENESLRETDNLLLQHHHSSMDLIPVTDSISHSLGSLDAQRLGGSPSPPSSQQGGIAVTMLGISTGTAATSSSASSKTADASGAAVKMAPPTNDLSPKNSTLKMMRLWDVSMGPYKKTMVGGVLVPNALAPVQFLRWTKRRVTLELYGEASAAATTSATPASSSGPPISEIVTDAEAPSSQKDHAGSSDKFALADSDVLYLRIYKQHHQHRRRRMRMGGGGNNNAGSSEDDDNLSVVDTDDDDASLISGIPESCTFLLCRPH